MYKDDLPQPHLVHTELDWFLFDNPSVKKANSITECQALCDSDLYPNINALLITATLPVTTCECERSFSTLRCLNTYLRRTQTNTRLDALALINIHCGDEVDVDEVVNKFAKLHSRKMELSSIIPSATYLVEYCTCLVSQ